MTPTEPVAPAAPERPSEPTAPWSPEDRAALRRALEAADEATSSGYYNRYVTGVDLRPLYDALQLLSARHLVGQGESTTSNKEGDCE